ncbi:MAG: glutamyl-tRNA reductase [Gemmatimonadota bacterium]|jgi:glutamyl-tRNA reductase|nr:glutamyl-tRNA reductase [Gemmatimonadota bacterium]
MPIIVIGANHRTAPIEVRERFSMSQSEAPGVVSRLVDSGAANEAVLLSTCNRTELYVAADDAQRAEAAFRGVLSHRLAVPTESLSGFLYMHRDRAAVQHLFRVTAGLDSMVLGEPQIQGQVREAYEVSRQTPGLTGSVVGPMLNRLFQTALSVGGRVRTETHVGLGAASISTAAVELAKKIFGTLRGRRALVMGAGEMSEVTLELLCSEGVRGTIVTNRTFARAVEMAGRWGGQAVPWDDFPRAIHGVDIVICSTAAPHPVITLERFRKAMPKGASRPLCIIDIAIPRDVEPLVGDEPNVFLYNIDDLRQVIDDSLERRRSEVPRADEIVAEVGEEYWNWYAGLAVVPTIRDLREKGEVLRQGELDRVMRRLSHLSAEDRSEVEAMTRSLLNKLLHTPTVRLREAAGNGRGTAVLDSARYLFELDGLAEDDNGAEPDVSSLDTSNRDTGVTDGPVNSGSLSGALEDRTGFADKSAGSLAILKETAEVLEQSTMETE